MSMSEKTSKMIRRAARGTFNPGVMIDNRGGKFSTIDGSSNQLSYWKSKGWIRRVGDRYILTKKGWREA